MALRRNRPLRAPTTISMTDTDVKRIMESLTWDDYETFQNTMITNPLQIRETVQKKISKEVALKIAYLICVVGPNPMNIVEKINYKVSDSTKATRIRELCELLYSQLEKLGIRGTHFQSAFPDMIYAYRTEFIKKGFPVQRFVPDDKLDISYQFSGSMPVVPDAEFAKIDYREFADAFSKTISQGQNPTADEAIYNQMLASRSMMASKMEDYDPMELGTALSAVMPSVIPIVQPTPIASGSGAPPGAGVSGPSGS